MLKVVKPELEDLWFRESMMADIETMSYNDAWGGTIPFPKEDWEEWYTLWVRNSGQERYYRYLKDDANKVFVGEISYHFDKLRNIYLCDVIIKEANPTLIFVEHDKRFVEDIANKIIRL